MAESSAGQKEPQHVHFCLQLLHLLLGVRGSGMAHIDTLATGSGYDVAFMWKLTKRSEAVKLLFIVRHWCPNAVSKSLPEGTCYGYAAVGQLASRAIGSRAKCDAAPSRGSAQLLGRRRTRGACSSNHPRVSASPHQQLLASLAEQVVFTCKRLRRLSVASCGVGCSSSCVPTAI
eukprot:1809789-Amphidinium_carterae.1